MAFLVAAFGQATGRGLPRQVTICRWQCIRVAPGQGPDSHLKHRAAISTPQGAMCRSDRRAVSSLPGPSGGTASTWLRLLDRHAFTMPVSASSMSICTACTAQVRSDAECKGATQRICIARTEKYRLAGCATCAAMMHVTAIWNVWEEVQMWWERPSQHGCAREDQQQI